MYYNPKRKHAHKNMLYTRIGETLTMKEGSEWRTPKSKKIWTKISLLHLTTEPTILCDYKHVGTVVADQTALKNRLAVSRRMVITAFLLLLVLVHGVLKWLQYPLLK